MLKKVLLPTDGSVNALKAAEFTVSLMKLLPGIEVTVINVYQVVPEFGIYDSGFETYDSLLDPGTMETVKQMSQRVIEKTVALFEQAGLKVNTVSVEGEPGRKIADFAKEGGYDHIIIGSRGMGALSGLASGSVTQKVLYFATCPVTVIKG